MSNRARSPWYVVTSVIAAAVVACGAVPAMAQPGPTPGAVPTPEWGQCAAPNPPDLEGFECATVAAPLDYEHPDKGTIELAVIRHRATDPQHRIGSLLFNPGGPGGSGTNDLPQLYPLFAQEMRERFDIVSWDPRGVGRSTSVQCFADKTEYDNWVERLPVGFPVGREEERRWIEGYAELGRRCQQRNPVLLRFVSTADTAQDMDLLRRVLGDQRLTYLGISYGTVLGATYANLFPDRIRAMVLDGNAYPSAWYDQNPWLPTFLRENSDLGSARTLGQFLDLCARAGRTRCPFAADNPWATRAKYEELMRRLLVHPQGEVTYAAVAAAVRGSLYFVHPPSPANWSVLAKFLQQLWEGQTPETPVMAAPPMAWFPTPSRVLPFPPGGPFPAQEQKYMGVEQALAVTCSESPNPPDPHAYGALAKFSTARAGTMGPWWTWVTEPCSTWPARAAHRYTGPWNRSATPILTVNTTYDPGTPYSSAQTMTAELGRARLLTVAGYGHTALLNPSSCANAHESDYLVRGVLPPLGTVCRQDTPPFTDTASEAPASTR